MVGNLALVLFRLKGVLQMPYTFIQVWIHLPLQLVPNWLAHMVSAFAFAIFLGFDRKMRAHGLHAITSFVWYC